MSDEPLARPVVIKDFPGLSTDRDRHELPQACFTPTDNIVFAEAGNLACRKGHVTAGFTPPASSQIISMFGMQRPFEYLLFQQCVNGNVYMGRDFTGTPTSIASGLNVEGLMTMARTRFGEMIGTNGIDRGIYYPGLGSTTFELGVDAPTTQPTINQLAGSGGATVGEYTFYYRYVSKFDSQYTPSNMSPATLVTAAALDAFEWTGFVASSQARVNYIELWRTVAEDAQRIYRIGRFSSGSNVTSSQNNGGNVQFTVDAGEPLELKTGSYITVAGHDVGAYNTQHQVTSVDGNKINTNTAYSSDGTGGSWTFTKYDQDIESDNDLLAYSGDDVMRFTLSNGFPNAQRFVPPPNWKAVCVQHQDCMTYLVDFNYTKGTITTTAGSKTVNGTGTDWTPEMVGRHVHINGEARPLKIAAWVSATQLTLEHPTANALTDASYAIRPPATERNRIYISERDEPESVPVERAIPLQDNKNDDDDLVGAIVVGSNYFAAKTHSLYRLTWVEQPQIDAAAVPVVERGAFNHDCLASYEWVVYSMDSDGPWAFDAGSPIPIDMPVHDYWREKRIDFSKKQWFKTRVDPLHQLVYFYVSLAGQSGDYPRTALVWHIRQKKWTQFSFPWPIGGGELANYQNVRRLIVGIDEGKTLVANEGTRDDGSDITYTWRTGLFEFVLDNNVESERFVNVAFTPTAGAATATLRLYHNHDTAAQTAGGDWKGEGVTSTKGSADFSIDLQTATGWAKLPWSGRGSPSRGQPARYLAIELTGTQSSGDRIEFHQVHIGGVFE